MLKQFNSLPSSNEAKNMYDSDYLYCYIHMLLDDMDEEDVEYEVNANFESSVGIR